MCVRHNLTLGSLTVHHFDSARFNLYWFAALIAPAAIMFAATYSRRRVAVIVGAVVSIGATFCLDVKAVEYKWELRMEAARTEDEQVRASADGANLLFMGCVGAPIESIGWTALWGVVGWRAWGRAKERRANLGT